MMKRRVLVRGIWSFTVAENARTRDAGGRSSSATEEASGETWERCGGVCGRERSSKCAQAKCIEAKGRRPWPRAAAVAARAHAATRNARCRTSWYAAPRNGLRRPVSDGLRPNGSDALAWIRAGAGAFSPWGLGYADGVGASVAPAVSWPWALGVSATAAAVTSLQPMHVCPAP